MTRRLFLAAFAPGVGVRLPNSGFEVQGHFTEAGQPGEGYYGIGQTVAFMIDPQKAPTMNARARDLLGKEVSLKLSEV